VLTRPPVPPEPVTFKLMALPNVVPPSLPVVAQLINVKLLPVTLSPKPVNTLHCVPTTQMTFVLTHSVTPLVVSVMKFLSPLPPPLDADRLDVTLLLVLSSLLITPNVTMEILVSFPFVKMTELVDVPPTTVLVNLLINPSVNLQSVVTSLDVNLSILIVTKTLKFVQPMDHVKSLNVLTVTTRTLTKLVFHTPGLTLVTVKCLAELASLSLPSLVV